MPVQITDLFDKPGRLWSDEEKEGFAEWLESQRKRLLVFILKCLGHWAHPEDAEDAWNSFLSNSFDRLINKYDPAQGKMIPFLKICLRRHCLRIRKKERERRWREISFDWPPLPASASSAQKLEIRLIDKGGTLQRLETSQWINRALAKLRKKNYLYFHLIVEHHLREKSTQEISLKLGKSKAAIVSTLFRARQELKRYMNEELVPIQQIKERREE